jgi:hypothetical protein
MLKVRIATARNQSTREYSTSKTTADDEKYPSYVHHSCSLLICSCCSHCNRQESTREYSSKTTADDEKYPSYVHHLSCATRSLLTVQIVISLKKGRSEQYQFSHKDACRQSNDFWHLKTKQNKTKQRTHHYDEVPSNLACSMHRCFLSRWAFL